MKSVLEYTSFREYLRDFYLVKKKTDGFTFREFSRLAGFTSPNFVKLVIDGVTRISPKSCVKLCKACGLKGTEKSHFRQLVALDQATTVDAKMSALARIKGLQSVLNIDPVKENQAAFYDAWHHAVVRELISMLGRATASEIASLLTPSLKEKQVQASINLLTSLDLIRKDSHDVYRPSSPFVSSGSKVPTSAVKNYQREMGLLGVDALFSLDKEEREISGATFCMSEKSARALMDKMRELRREALRMAHDDSAPERVYRLNVQLFPVSKSTRAAASPAQEGRP